VLIACLGLFGLAAYAVDRRTKEIGVRKILGASASRIVWLLSREFVIWILIANVLAWPGAYFIMRQWLKNFAYRTNIGVLVFIFSGALALLIALVTVSYHSIKAMLANPVDTLRYE